MAIYRPRLRSKEGCLRCRQRHAKCDEVRPVCSFCRRWNKECVWPEADKSLRDECPVGSKLSRSHSVSRAASRKMSIIASQGSKKTEVNHVWTQMPHSASEMKQTKILTCLQQFFVLITRQNLPFKDMEMQNPVVDGWFESALRDEAACYAFLTHWAKDQSRITGSPDMRLLGLKYEARTTSLLRKQIESGTALAEDVLLAASIHYMSAAFDISDISQLDAMLSGIGAVVDHFGGIKEIVAKMKPSTIFSVQHTDIFNALVNAKKLSFVHLQEPSRPSSLSTAFDQHKIDNKIGHCSFLESEVRDTIGASQLLLIFRNPSQQSRCLLDEEHKYLRSLEYWLNYQLGVLQHKYTGTASMEEISIIAMIILKLEIIAEECSHVILIRTALKRLRAAVNSCGSVIEEDQQDHPSHGPLIIWACLIALVGLSSLQERSWFHHYLRSILLHRYVRVPKEWPSDLEIKVRSELQQFPWHDRIDCRLTSILADLRNWPIQTHEYMCINCINVSE